MHFDERFHHVPNAGRPSWKSQVIRIAIDTVVAPGGWRIEIFHRKNPHGHKLQIFLQNLGLRTEKKRGRYVLPRDFEYTSDSDMIADEVQKVVNKIARSNGDS